MKRIVLIRSNPVTPDPPVEKVANVLLGAGYQITILGWDRSASYKLGNGFSKKKVKQLER